MKHSLKSCFIVGLYLPCLSSYQSLSGQDWMGAQSDQWKVEQEVISLLEDEGFQNIAVRLDSTTFRLTFENRLFDSRKILPRFQYLLQQSRPAYFLQHALISPTFRHPESGRSSF